MDATAGKLTPGLYRTLGTATPSRGISVLVRYSPDRRVLRHRDQMVGVRETYHYRLRPFVQMHATPDAIERLAADPDVVRIYEDLPVRALLDQAVPAVRAPLMWDARFTGEGISIAIVDTGLDVDHPDLRGRIAEAVDMTGEGFADAHGHGTHCAGIAAGSGAASRGLYRGAAPGATILAAKVLGQDGEGMTSDVMAGVEWAHEHGARVISLSLGASGPCDGNDALSEMCDAAAEQGSVVVVAAGNDGPLPGTVGSPGAARRVISVGATDDRDRIASFSSRGPTMDGRAKPDIVAPGVGIVAARARGTRMGLPVDDYYTSASGTSMATPLVAGLVALLWQAQPSLSAQEVAARIIASAVDLGESRCAQGRGRADVWAAYERLSTSQPPFDNPPPGLGCLPSAIRSAFVRRRNIR